MPFIVWVHRYSDRLGFEPVPMVDDLYSDRLAAVDFGLFLGGSAILVATDLGSLPPTSAAVGGVLVLGGALCFFANLAGVIRTHSPYSTVGLLVGKRRPAKASASHTSGDTAEEG